jgi:hypothetical protein
MQKRGQIYLFLGKGDRSIYFERERFDDSAAQ